MAAAVRLREDYDAAQLRGLAKRSSDAAQTRRLLALAAIYDGGSRTEAAKLGGAPVRLVPRDGHMSNIENPQEFNREENDWKAARRGLGEAPSSNIAAER